MSLFYIERPGLVTYTKPDDLPEYMPQWDQITDYSFKPEEPGDFYISWNAELKACDLMICVDSVEICNFDCPHLVGASYGQYSGFKLENLDNTMEHHIFVKIKRGSIKNLRIIVSLINDGTKGNHITPKKLSVE